MKDLGDYYVDFKTKSRGLTENEERFDLIHEFEGRITREPGPDDLSRKSVEVGRIRGAHLDLGSLYERPTDLFSLLDAHSSEMEGLYSELFEGNELREDLDLDSLGDLLFVSEVKVARKHRGMNLGLLAVLQTIEEFGGGCSVVAIKPFPLQFTGRVTDKNEQKFDAAQKKLQGYWSRFGFKRYKDTDYFYFDLAHKRPTQKKLLAQKKRARREQKAKVTLSAEGLQVPFTN
jgi:hypothetical protein